MPSVMQTTTRDAGVGRLHHRVGGKRRRHEDHRRVGSGLFDRVTHRVEDRPALVRRAALTRGDAADDGGAVGGGLLGVKGPFAAGQALDEQAGVSVDENSHISC